MNYSEKLTEGLMYLITRQTEIFRHCWATWLVQSKSRGQKPYIILSLTKKAQWTTILCCSQIQHRGQKTGSFCIVCYQKQIHLAQTLPFQKDSGMDQQPSIQSSSQAKSRGDENRDSNDNSSEHEETATRTTKQVYPWMTEFRTKGTKQYSIRFRKYCLWICKSYFTEQFMGVDLNECTALFTYLTSPRILHTTTKI